MNCVHKFAFVLLIGATLTAASRDYDLTIKIENSGDRDGTYTLGCHPSSGTHPAAQIACQTIDAAVTAGVKPFADKPGSEFCTMQYGGPDKATVTGTWTGAPVNAVFTRRDGCEISRWDRLAAVFMTGTDGQIGGPKQVGSRGGGIASSAFETNPTHLSFALPLLGVAARHGLRLL